MPAPRQVFLKVAQEESIRRNHHQRLAVILHDGEAALEALASSSIGPLELVYERARLDAVLPKGDNRPRVAASAAAIVSGWRLLVAVAQSRSLLAADDATRRVDELRLAITGLAIEQVVKTANLAPGERYLADLRQLLAADVLKIDGLTEPGSRGVRVGFAAEGWIGVFPEVSVTRINEFLHRDGDKLPSTETIGTSLDVIGAFVAKGKDRVASRKGDPDEPRKKVPVWLIRHERLDFRPEGVGEEAA